MVQIIADSCGKWFPPELLDTGAKLVNNLITLSHVAKLQSINFLNVHASEPFTHGGNGTFDVVQSGIK